MKGKKPSSTGLSIRRAAAKKTETDESLASDDWTPVAHERRWYNHLTTGDRAYLVRRGGEECLKIDRPMIGGEEIIRKLDGNWREDREWRPVNAYQLAKVAFEADREACRAFGMHDEARKDWLALKQPQRVSWVNDGPKSPEFRVSLFRAIREWGREYIK